jgi:biofilm PGA synthesis N-glycosyltransferase PgaC
MPSDHTVPQTNEVFRMSPTATPSRTASRAMERFEEPAPVDPSHAFPDDFQAVLDVASTARSTIGCIIPAYNEEESIEDVILALLAQTRVPDVIHVVVNNTSDATVKIASRLAGPHEIVTELGEQFTEVFVHDIGKNPDKKVGALNYGFTLVEGYDYLLGVDGDTVADAKAVEYLETEIMNDTRIGGISAIYSIDDKPFKGIASFLITGQRSQFAAFNLQNLLRGRNMAVLGGQFSIFSTQALRDVMRENHQSTPWVKDSEVEDSLLSLQIKSAGYLTKISPFARADVGGMTTLRALDAQQVKWTYGAIELMWPGQRGDTKGQPFHPNLRLRWLENFGMLTNLFVRVAFLTLLAASLSINAFIFSPLWLVPIAMAVALNLRMALTMKNRDHKDVLFALLIIPAETYMWIRIAHFLRAWTRFLSRKKVDNWAMQAKAERGAGLGHWTPLIIGVAVVVALVVIWNLLSTTIQSTILWIGWPIVGVVTVLQTLLMFSKLVRRQHGFKV